MRDSSLIDQIYEAAFVPEYWETVCESLSAEVESFSASLITLDGNQSYRWISSPNVREHMERFSQSPLRFENGRVERHAALSPFSFMRDVDLMSEAELAGDPIYNEFLRPLGLGWTIGDMIQEPSGHVIVFDIIRSAARGSFEQSDVDRLNALRPHLARAATMSSRLEFERINAAVEALELTGLPAAVVGAGGKVLAANDLLQALVPQVTIAAYDKVLFGSADAQAKFEDALSRGKAGVSASCSFPLSQVNDRPPAIVHLVPVRGHARDIFSHAAFFLIATPVDRSRVPTAETIQGLFDLSPAEARVARSLSMGNDVGRTASDFSLSPETVRSHVKAILGKCGMSRQADFVAAIASIRPIGTTDE